MKASELVRRNQNKRWSWRKVTSPYSYTSVISTVVPHNVFAWRIFQLNPDWARFGRTGPTLCIPVPVIFSLHWSHSCYISRYISRYILFWTWIPRSVPGRYLSRIDPMFQISRHLPVESSRKVSNAGPGSIHVLRPNSVSDFQYRPVFGREVGRVGSKVKPGLDPTGIHYWF